MPDSVTTTVDNSWVLGIDVPGFDVSESELAAYVEAEMRNDSKDILEQLLNEVIKAKITALEKATNLPIANIKAYLDLVAANDVVVSFRDPGEFSLEQLKRDAAGKSFTEKGKSSVHGEALAGLIPRNQALSKAGDDGREAAFNEKVEHRLADCKDAVDQIGEALRQGQPIDPRVFEQNLVVSKQLLSADGREVFFSK